jgi:ABC-type Fe3+-siderophore transport system, permease component
MLQEKKHILLLIGSTLLLFAANLFWGSVSIPAEAVWSILTQHKAEKQAWIYIIWESRFPQAVTALFTGGAIAVSGLMLQTVFGNPLADPGILGISAGSSLGVALVLLFFGGIVGSAAGITFSGTVAVVAGAFTGAVLILILIIIMSSIVKNNIMLLIIGIMIGYITSSLISLLNFFGSGEKVFAYVMWGMGDFSAVSTDQLPVYCLLILCGLFFSILLIKPLNALLLGERYAANLGVNIKRVRLQLLICVGLLTAITTAFCGPISFIGLAVPHMARLLLKTSNHQSLVPVTLLTGSFIALACNLISSLPGSSGVIPLNAITPIFGAPVIIYVIVKQKKINYFN